MDGGEGLRAEFRAHATAQRAVLSDGDQLASRVGDERDGIEARPEEERTPEDGMRVAQLSNVLEHLHRARERMGQARRQLRQRQGSRAYRRTSAGLVELKRAQDQLREPVAVLDQILADGMELARGTALLSLSGRDLPGLSEALPPVPPWLTIASLADGQISLADRASELQLRFAAGLEHANADPASIPPDQVELIEAVRQAEPLVREGTEYARTAATALEEQALEAVPESQRRSLTALGDARERFLDVRGLIEATHREEQQIAQIVGAEGPDAAVGRAEFLPELRVAQQRNLTRGERLERKLGARGEQLEAAAAAADQGNVDPNAPPPDPQRLEEERKHLDIAQQILTLALAGMDGVREGLGDESLGEARVDWDWVRSDAAKALEHLETLRRLFFSMTEHLRDVARRQIDLADRTQDALALSSAPDRDPSAEAAPLVETERGLAEQALAIATALEQQSTEAGGAGADDPQAAEAATRLREAADHVLLAQGEMESAAGSLSAPANLASARTAQDLAIEEVEKALAVLEPPKEGEQGEQNPQQGDSGEGSQDEQQAQQPDAGQQQAGESGEQAPGEQQSAELGADPGQLLQEVRDREAQRRRERANRQSRYETVEKDW
jgi:hypothetical protein